MSAADAEAFEGAIVDVGGDPAQFRATWDAGITAEEAKGLADAASSTSWLSQGVTIIEGREVWPEHPTVAKLRSAFEEDRE